MRLARACEFALLDMQASRPITLPELLQRHGYGVHYDLSGDHTNFYGLRATYGAADSYFDGASQNARYVNDDRLVLDRLRSFGRWDGKPMMLQVHLMSSHALGKRFDDVTEFGPERELRPSGLDGQACRARARASISTTAGYCRPIAWSGRSWTSCGMADTSRMRWWC